MSKKFNEKNNSDFKSENEKKIEDNIEQNSTENFENSNSENSEEKLNDINFSKEFMEKIEMYMEEKKKLEEEIKLIKESSIEKLREQKNYFLQELENQKKYYSQELENLSKFSFEKLFKDLLVVIDSFKIGLKTKHDNYEKFIDGLNMTYNIFFNLLKKYHLSIVEVKKGDIFNEEFHECIGNNPEEEKNKISQILEDGYLLHDRLIRPARVIVGSKE